MTVANGMRRWIGALLAMSASAPAMAYSLKDAEHVVGEASRATLAYVVCLEKHMDTSADRSIPEALEASTRACRALERKLPRSSREMNAEEIQLQIMECGFRPGDADGC